MPTRMPPKIYWIVGAYLPVYIYYLVSEKFGSLNNFFTNFCCVLGRNTLICLVVSNLCIFLSCRLWYEAPISMILVWYAMLSAIVISFCFGTIKLSELVNNQIRLK